MQRLRRRQIRPLPGLLSSCHAAPPTAWISSDIWMRALERSASIAGHTRPSSIRLPALFAGAFPAILATWRRTCFPAALQCAASSWPVSATFRHNLWNVQTFYRRPVVGLYLVSKQHGLQQLHSTRVRATRPSISFNKRVRMRTTSSDCMVYIEYIQGSL